MKLLVKELLSFVVLRSYSGDKLGLADHHLWTACNCQNVKMSKEYHRYAAFTGKVLELLCFMTRRLVTPDHQNWPCSNGKLRLLSESLPQ